LTDETKIINGRFHVEETLGVGAQGRTFLARDGETDGPVALKRLSLTDALDWKAIELFEREGNALASLDHPYIPSYVDAFHVEDGGRREFYLAQSYIEGDTLEALVQAGERWDSDALVDFLDQLLDILIYLGGRRPPVVHRDIKPTNLLRDPDGRYHLIDFGAVQTVVSSATGASTVIGTGGFVPVEQLMGQASPVSDLYSLGATAAYLASGVHPSQMECVGLRLQFRRYVQLRPAVAGLVERLLAPQPTDRFSSATEAQKALRDQTTTALARAFPYRVDGGRISFAYNDGAMVIEIRDRSGRRRFVTGAILCALTAIGLAAMAALMGGIAGWILGPLSLPFFLGAGAMATHRLARGRRRRVVVERGRLVVHSRAIGRWVRSLEVDVRDIIGIEDLTREQEVRIFSGVQTVVLPDLESAASEEIVTQLRLHTGVRDG
jgi:hypothetical protein